MAVSVWLSGAEAALRVASLNLCTDEYLLLLGRPAEIVSLSHLSREPLESSLWRSARRYPSNNGTLESVVATRPRLVLTMGGAGKASAAIAQRLGIRVLTLDYPMSLEDVRQQTIRVATVLGDGRRALPFVQAMDALRRSRPQKHADGAFLSGGGETLEPKGLGADWLRLVGIRQRGTPNGRLSLETLATRPPKWLIRSDYRQRQVSRNAAWLHHPVVQRLAPRTVITDGRRWTCAGLPMIPEVQRLRSKVG